jgi:hypothetical protein
MMNRKRHDLWGHQLIWIQRDEVQMSLVTDRTAKVRLGQLEINCPDVSCAE